MLTYLIQVIACSGVLYGYYHFFLRNEKFHQYNRFYLLITFALSLLLPLLKIPVNIQDNENTNLIYTFVSTGENVVITAQQHFDYTNLLYIGYVLAALFLTVRLVAAIIKIVSIKKSAVAETIEDIQFIKTTHPDSPFSFFKWLFWNQKTELQSAEGHHMFRHEMYHIRSKHSWDLLFIELTLCIFWLNPFFYLYRKEIKTIQEFLADKYASEGKDISGYAEILLLQAINVKQQKLINPFFHNQLKRRIAMLLSSKKPRHQWLRKLFVLPLAAILLTLFAFTYKKEVSKVVPTLKKLMTPGDNNNIKPDYKTAALSLQNPNSASAIDTVPAKNENQQGNLVSAEYETSQKRYLKLNTITVTTWTAKEPEKKVFKEGAAKIDVAAAYPGNWNNFLEKNIDALTATKNEAPRGNYTVEVRFIINEDGSLSDFVPLTDEGYGMEDEVIRVLKKSDNWKPSLNNKDGGAPKPVKSYRIQPITFQVLQKGEAADNLTEAAAREEELEIFTKTEQDAEYPDNWRSFLERNLNVEVPVNNGAPAGNYTTIIQFIVDKDGNTGDFKALTNVGYGMETEALRVMKRSGKWKPAVQNGRIVKAYRKQPITFQIIDDTKKKDA